MTKLLIKGGRLLDPASHLDRVADLLVENGKIVQIGEGLPEAGARVVDAHGKVVAPGFIDIHVHLRDPGQEHKEDLRTGSMAAVRGGYVAVVCMPNTAPVVDNVQTVTYIRAKAQEVALCKVWPTGAITKGSQGEQIAEIGEMRQAGIVAITDDGRPVENAEIMRLALEYAAQFGIPVMDHCEDRTLSAGGAMRLGEVSTMLGLRGYASSAEEVHVARDILLSLQTGAHIHLQHLHSARSIDLVRWGKQMGARVTCEVTPHHFTLTDRAVAEMNYSTNTKMNPPLGSEADRLALIEGLKDGTIDLIATDHAPHHIDDKEVEYQYAAFGITGLETAVGLTLDRLVHAGHLTLAQMIQKMSTVPAQVLGIKPPALTEGAEADITIFDPEQRWTVKAAEMASKSKNSPFIGWELRGGPYATVVSGKLVMEKMQVLSN